MKIIEILEGVGLKETAQHDTALWATARNILKPLMRDAGREQGPALDQYENGQSIGSIGKLDPSSLKEIHDVIIQYAPGETSEYFPVNSTSRTDLLANYNANKRYILLGGSSYGLDKEKNIISQLAHEMRHALDDTLSSGKFNRSHGRGATAYRPSTPDSNQLKDREHENRPLEINAHYTQALEDIAKAVKSTTTTAQLHKIITQAFKNRWVGKAYRYNTQDPNYRRLVQRAVQYAQTIIQQKQEKLASKANPQPVAVENFADGRHPEDKGDSKRLGVPTHASVSTLRKVAHQGGRKGQLAHWMANMKAGKKKHAGK